MSLEDSNTYTLGSFFIALASIFIAGKVVSSIYYKLNIELYNKKFYNQTHNYFIGKIRSLPKKKNYWNNRRVRIW